MRQLHLVVAVVAVQQCLIACASPAVDSPTSAPDSLEQDLGGPAGLMEFFSSSDEQAIRETLALYGMDYAVHEVTVDDKNIADCPQFFPSIDRNIWHNFDGEFYYVDGSGRPQRAYKYLPPIAAAPRNETCQGNVGRWGDAENPANNYDGGHLIAASLGGWGKRANLVPQDSNFNQHASRDASASPSRSCTRSATSRLALSSSSAQPRREPTCGSTRSRSPARRVRR